jgi:hypothetical protein
MRALEQLAECKGEFGREAARRTSALLERVARMRFRKAAELIRLHETVLFLRANPQSARVAKLADGILFSFAERMRGVDAAPFDDPEVSGIAGTSLSTNFSFEFASFLTRGKGEVEIDWEDYAHPERLGTLLGHMIPMAYEDWAVEPHVDWRAWFDAAGWNLARVLEEVGDPRVYDLLEIPLRWNLRASAASRSVLRLPRREMFYHDGPFLKRRDVSLEGAFAEPAIAVTLSSPRRGKAIVRTILAASATRYRELYGFQFPDDEHVYHADLGRGVDLYFFGVPPERRLPLRAYHCGMFFKNGVPMGYIETLSLFERCEVGFNLFYTFREGETAWLYARLLKILHEQLGVTCFSVDPYQIGHENDEAIESGAFWFYYKLGFRPASCDNARLAAREEERIAKTPEYRTSAAILRRLAEAPLFYGDSAADWAKFSLHRLGAKVPVLGDNVVRAKRGAEEVRYLRMLQRRPDLRKKVLRLR